MPYRRLPNTDSARIRAMKSAIDAGMKNTPQELAFSQGTLMQLRTFLPVFEQAVNNQYSYQKTQIERNKKFQETIKKARLYLSHFVQVMNMSIMRGETKPEIRESYGIRKNDKKVPELSTEKDLMVWGKRIIEGEEMRLANGAGPITNPTIARVKVHYQDFMQIWQNQQHHSEIFQKAHEKVIHLRKDADQLIVALWNQIENSFSKLNPQEARNKAAAYGVKYVYRKNERLRPFLNINYGNVSQQI